MTSKMAEKMVVMYLHWHNGGYVMHPCPMPFSKDDNGEDGAHGLVKESELDA
jgi:hypothetical protein